MPHVASHTPGSFCWFELATNDQAAAKRFYQSLFGWAAEDEPMGPDEMYSRLTTGGGEVGGLYSLHKEQLAHHTLPHWLLYVAVANADDAAAKAVGAGGVVIVPAFDVRDYGRMAVIQDPAGAIFGVWQAGTHVGTTIAGEPYTVCWADLVTPDVPKAVKFYGHLFGWKVTGGKNKATLDPNDYGHIATGPDFIGGMPPASMRDPHAPPHWMIYIEVPDCAASVAKARSLGARVYMDTQQMGDNTWAIVADPQGAVFALHTANRP